ncbi:hypothetical protein Tco_0155362 [Tanacetum coccineum]
MTYWWSLVSVCVLGRLGAKGEVQGIEGEGDDSTGRFWTGKGGFKCEGIGILTSLSRSFRSRARLCRFGFVFVLFLDIRYLHNTNAKHANTRSESFINPEEIKSDKSGTATTNFFQIKEKSFSLGKELSTVLVSSKKKLEDVEGDLVKDGVGLSFNGFFDLSNKKIDIQ